MTNCLATIQSHEGPRKGTHDLDSKLCWSTPPCSHMSAFWALCNQPAPMAIFSVLYLHNFLLKPVFTMGSLNDHHYCIHLTIATKNVVQ